MVCLVEGYTLCLPYGSQKTKSVSHMHHKKQTESVRWSLDGHVYWHCRASIKGMPWLSLSKPRYVIRYYPKIFFFSASNSASVRTPDSCNAPSCFNCSRPSSVKPVGCAGVATCGGAGGGCWETGCAACCCCASCGCCCCASCCCCFASFLACRLLLINRVSSLQGGRWHVSVLPTLRSRYLTGQARRKEKGRPY